MNEDFTNENVMANHKRLRPDLGLSQESWKRYKELKAKRDDETLTDEEHSELIAFSDEIEMANTERIGYLVELALSRNVSLEKVMADLGIQTPPYD